jgi:hypothetical protein
MTREHSTKTLAHWQHECDGSHFTSPHLSEDGRRHNFLLFFHISEACYPIPDEKGARTTVLSRRECGFYGRVPPPIAPGCPAHERRLLIHLIISQKPASTANMAGYLMSSSFLISVRAAMSNYTFLPLLASACSSSLWRLLSQPTTTRALNYPWLYRLHSNQVCKQAADVCISRPASHSNRLSCLYSSRALTILLPANDSHAPSRSLEGSRRGQY